ncbi:lipocalin-like domain-containing protein [Phytohalomonas tamaricis]|uniref:lipocalin-like domain-containing protein n=1 Tax=Phytohalomonas tamaricis TaxID=2081032 RepID=UPI000D0AFF67|nr:lipocalin-like domain-containing protein [Phytohalomonas tamaricis]
MSRTLLGLLVLATLMLSGCGDDDAPAAGGHGYADLGNEAAGYAQATPGATLAFPVDHGTHPDYRIEWWYLTANLEDDAGHTYGLQWTLFRQAMSPPGREQDTKAPWASRQLWMAHAAVTTPNGHRASERFARGGSGQAGVTAAPFAAWLDDWELKSTGEAFTPLTVAAATDDFSYRLELTADGPLVLQGNNGFSQKSADGQGSYYYSQPFLHASGTLNLDGQPVEVHGQAWLDREWSSQLLGGDQAGWDWFSLHLDDGYKLMAFRLRGSDAFISGSWIAPDGMVTPLAGDDITLEPLEQRDVQGHRLPLRWRLQLARPGRDITLDVTATIDDQWMNTTFAYWEGAVQVNGDHKGVGYLEMTGY